VNQKLRLNFPAALRCRGAVKPVETDRAVTSRKSGADYFNSSSILLAAVAWSPEGFKVNACCRLALLSGRLSRYWAVPMATGFRPRPDFAPVQNLWPNQTRLRRWRICSN